MGARHHRGFFRKANSQDTWTEIAPFDRFPATGVRLTKEFFQPVRSRCYYLVVPLWRISYDALQFRELDLHVKLRIGKTSVTSNEVRIQLAPVPPETLQFVKLNSDSLHHYLSADRLFWDRPSNELVEALRSLPETKALGPWLKLMIRLRHLCYTDLLREQELQDFFKELDSLPPIMRETIGLKLGLELNNFLMHRNRDKEPNVPVMHEMLAVAEECLAPCHSGNSMAVHVRELLQRTKRNMASREPAGQVGTSP
ncbi:hypothetical protein ETAA8_34270 [Anatilimnocola aggregata]|uniref:Uncharacterized protein n=1 Tax=Anatilimnocola aggregata TaxID=2528021 RepID=A0A517YDL3_9BACT|nr:hypothetical protein [Anatilimnocola aggregata]QDU28327.1 hypothetical protein ETAA8_34270 [Anatilimnocola aggregata]